MAISRPSGACSAAGKRKNKMFFEEYTKQVIDHFMQPRNDGEMQDADAVGQAGDPSCGDAVGIYIKVKGDIIEKASFVVMGCVAAVATSSMTTVLITGRTLDEAYALKDSEIAEALGGLPEHKMHCSVMGAKAVKDAIENYRAGIRP